jgi:hypothetical protein
METHTLSGGGLAADFWTAMVESNRRIEILTDALQRPSGSSNEKPGGLLRVIRSPSSLQSERDPHAPAGAALGARSGAALA